MKLKKIVALFRKYTKNELTDVIEIYKIKENIHIGALVQRENTSLAAKGSGVRIPYAP